MNERERERKKEVGGGWGLRRLDKNITACESYNAPVEHFPKPPELNREDRAITYVRGL